jgi:hypothetical protein
MRAENRSFHTGARWRHEEPLHRSSEREIQCMHAGVKEFDRESPVWYLALLPDELIEARFTNLTAAVTLRVLTEPNSQVCQPTVDGKLDAGNVRSI